MDTNPNNLIPKDQGKVESPTVSVPQTTPQNVPDPETPTPPVNLNPDKIVEIKNNSQTAPPVNNSLPPQIKNANPPSPPSAVKTDFYADLNKLPTNPNVSLLNQSTPFTPVANKQQDSILAPVRPSAAEAHYLSASTNKVVTEAQGSQQAGIVPSISNIYSSLQSEAEKSEAIALRGSGVGSYFLDEESFEKENSYADFFVALFSAASILVIILPIFNIFTDIVKLLFFPTLLFIIVSVLISAAFKINTWIATVAFVTLLVQLLISVVVIMRVFGIFMGDIPFISIYLSHFFL